jgi:23S rRNA (pseudouridine1915-N3)-methyltransferase
MLFLFAANRRKRSRPEPVSSITVKIKVAWIGKTRETAIQSLADEYVKRISRYAQVQGISVRDESTILHLAGQLPDNARKSRSREKSTLVLLDSRGSQLSSEEFARFLSGYQDSNPLPLVFAVGPADGFTETARRQAQHLISLGKMTLPHELARIVLLEQLYRAFTILKNHPYHSGH